MCFKDCSGHCAQDRLSRRCSGSHVVAQARWPTTERGWGRELCKVYGSRSLSGERVNADAVSAKGEREWVSTWEVDWLRWVSNLEVRNVGKESSPLLLDVECLRLCVTPGRNIREHLAEDPRTWCRALSSWEPVPTTAIYEPLFHLASTHLLHIPQWPAAPYETRARVQSHSNVNQCQGDLLCRSGWWVLVLWHVLRTSKFSFQLNGIPVGMHNPSLVRGTLSQLLLRGNCQTLPLSGKSGCKHPAAFKGTLESAAGWQCPSRASLLASP